MTANQYEWLRSIEDNLDSMEERIWQKRLQFEQIGEFMQPMLAIETMRSQLSTFLRRTDIKLQRLGADFSKIIDELPMAPPEPQPALLGSEDAEYLVGLMLREKPEDLVRAIRMYRALTATSLYDAKETCQRIRESQKAL